MIFSNSGEKWWDGFNLEQSRIRPGARGRQGSDPRNQIKRGGWEQGRGSGLSLVESRDANGWFGGDNWGSGSTSLRLQAKKVFQVFYAFNLYLWLIFLSRVGSQTFVIIALNSESQTFRFPNFKFIIINYNILNIALFDYGRSKIVKESEVFTMRLQSYGD